MFFFLISRGKVHRSFNQILMKFLFLYKSWFCFFPHFCELFYFFFFSTEKFKGHSFIRFWWRKKNKLEKKKTAFSFVHSIFLKNSQKRTRPGKKIRYLWMKPGKLEEKVATPAALRMFLMVYGETQQTAPQKSETNKTISREYWLSVEKRGAGCTLSSRDLHFTSGKL